MRMLLFLALLFSCAIAQVPPPVLERSCPEDTVYGFCFMRIAGPLPEPVSYQLLDEEARPLNWNDLRKMLSAPQWAFDAGILPTKVLFSMLVDERGYPVKIHPVERPFPVSLYANIWLPVVAKLRFSPALQKGNPVVSQIYFPIEICLME